MSITKKLKEMKRGYLWVTLIFFIVSIVGHWVFGWYAYKAEAHEHNAEPEVKEYLIEMSRDTLENWQSEFLQLIWQVCGLAYLLYIGSPQSRESDERKDLLLEHILRKVDPENGDAVLKEAEEQYPKE
jgi:hypothetical protein